MAGDWIKLHRKLLESSIIESDGLCRLWVICLLRAQWKASTKLIGGTMVEVEVPRGSFLTGRHALHALMYKDAAGAPNASTVWRWLERLRDMGCVELRNMHNRCTLVSICNYETYQDNETDECASDAQVMRSRCASDAQVMRTIKERKKEKKGKKETKNGVSGAPGREYSSEFAAFWETFPPVRKGSKPEAWKAWQAAIARAPVETILAAATEFAASPLASSKFCPGPAPWLNKDRWDDDRRSWQVQDAATPLVPPVASRLMTAADKANWNPIDGGLR